MQSDVKVLLVDDNPMILSLLNDALSPLMPGSLFQSSGPIKLETALYFTSGALETGLRLVPASGNVFFSIGGRGTHGDGQTQSGE